MVESKRGRDVLWSLDPNESYEEAREVWGGGCGTRVHLLSSSLSQATVAGDTGREDF